MNYRNYLLREVKASSKKVTVREIPLNQRADKEALIQLEKGISSRVAENEAMSNRSMLNALGRV